MRFCPPRVLPLLAYGLAAALGCAGAGSATGTGGVTAGPRQGRLVQHRHRRTSSSGSAGTTGGGGTSGSGIAGTTGSGGSVGPGAGGMSAAADDRQRGGRHGRRGTIRSTERRAPRARPAAAPPAPPARAAPAASARWRRSSTCRRSPTVYLVVDRSGSMFHCLTTSELVCSTKADTSWTKLKTAIQTVMMQLDARGSLRLHDDLRDQSDRGRIVPAADRGHARRQRHPEADQQRRHQDQVRRARHPVAEPERRDEHGQEVRVAGDVLDPGGHQGAHGRHDAGRQVHHLHHRRTGGLLRRRARDLRVRLHRRRAAGRVRGERQDDRLRPSDDAVQSARRRPAGLRERRRGRDDGAGPDVRPRHDRDLRPVPGRHALEDGSDGVGPPDHARTDGDGGDVRDDGGTDQALQARAPRTQTMLVTQLSKALAGVKSCTFDLNDVGGKTIKVDTSKLTQAHVLIQGTEVPLERHQRLERRRRRRRRSWSSAAPRARRGACRTAPRSISSSRAAASSSSKPMTKTHSFACLGATALLLAWLHRRRQADTDRNGGHGLRHRGHQRRRHQRRRDHGHRNRQRRQHRLRRQLRHLHRRLEERRRLRGDDDGGRAGAARSLRHGGHLEIDGADDRRGPRPSGTPSSPR